MSKFEVLTYPVKIEPHPDADLLECARIGDYFCIVGKNQFRDGDIAAYIPEAAIVPDQLISAMGLEGKLAGKAKNRVKAIKLRGVLSQGLVYAMPEKKAGVDVTEELGIVKYEPPIPVQMAGKVRNAFGKTVKYDIENIKKYPDMFTEGEPVVITEKLHGTWCCWGWYDGELLISSHGLSDKGLALKVDEESLAKNLYVKMWKQYEDKFYALRDWLEPLNDFYLLGEIYGAGVQDLKYGAKVPEFRAFDLFLEFADGHRRYSDLEFIESMGFPVVPILYEGPYSRAILDELTDGKTYLGGGANIREGVVVKPIPENECKSELTGHRKIAKSVSADYLLRKGGTEYT